MTSPALISLFPGFDHCDIDVGSGVHIAATVGGSGPPLLLLHGHPQTRAIWHRVAPALAARHTIVAADLRGYGDSSKPEGGSDHANYSKRVMAIDQLSLMRSLGFERFDVVAHDRGARVAHRLAADHPDAVNRLVLMDVAPTLAMYEQTSNDFARLLFQDTGSKRVDALRFECSQCSWGVESPSVQDAPAEAVERLPRNSAQGLDLQHFGRKSQRRVVIQKHRGLLRNLDWWLLGPMSAVADTGIPLIHGLPTKIRFVCALS